MTSGTSVLYFKSLNRQFYILGIDRQLFFLLLGLCVPIAYSARFDPMMDILAVVVFIIGYIACVWITRADPKLLPIYLRHIRYRHYYSALTHVSAPIRITKPSVPFYMGKKRGI
jgi:type IV secretory pathway TrbD component